MIIKVNNDYQVDAQKYNNWILQRITNANGQLLVDKDDNPTPKAIAYYPDLPSALKACYKQQVIEDNEELTLIEFLGKLNEASQKLSEIVAKFEVGGM